MTNKKFILISCLILLFANTAASQELQGTYYEKGNSERSKYFIFDSSCVDFVINSDGCLIIELRGNGHYKIVENYLIIKTEELKNTESFYEAFPKQKNESGIRVMSLEGENIPFVIILFVDDENNILSNTYTDFDGLVSVKSDFKIKKIKVSSVGFQGLTFDFYEGKDYKIYLSEGVVIEKGNVVFKINSMSNDEVSLTLLSTNFKYKRNLEKALHKLEKRVDELNPNQTSYTK